MKTEERILMLSSRIELLFGFCATLIPDIDLLEEAQEKYRSNASLSKSAAPIFGAMNRNYEDAVFNWELREKRAGAMVNLLKVLRDTDNERRSREDKLEQSEIGRNILKLLL